MWNCTTWSCVLLTDRPSLSSLGLFSSWQSGQELEEPHLCHNLEVCWTAGLTLAAWTLPQPLLALPGCQLIHSLGPVTVMSSLLTTADASSWQLLEVTTNPIISPPRCPGRQTSMTGTEAAALPPVCSVLCDLVLQLEGQTWRGP